MKKIIIFYLIFVSCETPSDLTSAETSWLNSVSNTSWSNEDQTILFNTSGKTITIQNDKNYNYEYSSDSISGVYTTMLEFPPTEWYLFVLSDDTLIQYGGFLGSNLISQDKDSELVFTK